MRLASKKLQICCISNTADEETKNLKVYYFQLSKENFGIPLHRFGTWMFDCEQKQHSL